MAFLIVEKGNSQDIGKRFAVKEDVTVAGRGTAASSPDIALHDEFVSRRHIEISLAGRHFRLRDLNSTNGTTLDGVRIDPGKVYELRHDSVIGLGITSGAETRVTLRFKEAPTTTTVRLTGAPDETAQIVWLRIDAEKGEIWVDGARLILSRKEYDLVCCLREKAGKVCQRDELIARVWPEVLDSEGVSDAAIDQLVHRLRLKIEPDPAQPKRLISRKGFGYMLV